MKLLFRFTPPETSLIPFVVFSHLWCCFLLRLKTIPSFFLSSLPCFISSLPFLPSLPPSFPPSFSSIRFRVEFVTYKWPEWLRRQSEKQRIIWGYKILFLDVLFPLHVDKVIYVDADQVGFRFYFSCLSVITLLFYRCVGVDR